MVRRATWVLRAGSLGLALAACASNDARPVIENASTAVLEIASVHDDGHRLTAVLYPGAAIALGRVSSPVEQIDAYRDGDAVLSLSRAQIDACLGQMVGRCTGWRLADDGARRVEIPPTGSPVRKEAPRRPGRLRNRP